MDVKLHQLLKDVKGIGPKRYQIVLNKLEKTGKSIESVFALPATDIKSIFGLPINVARMIENTKIPYSVQKSKTSPTLILTPEIITVTQQDIHYPIQLKRILGNKAPNVLYMWGNLELLEKPSVGFCGSRNVSQRGIDVTIDTARQVADLDWVVVSGHARGVDTAAHRTALENDAGTIIVISEGIDSFKLRKELKTIAKPENILVISEFPREAGWTSWRAMQRNQTIIALSDAMVILESRLKGGTFNAGKTAIQLRHPLYVVVYQGNDKQSAGNEYFIKRGVQKLMKSKDTNRANLSHLRQTVASHRRNLRENDQQLELKPQQLSLLEVES